VQEVTARTSRPEDVPDGVFAAMIRRIAMNQLIDEELRRREP
jgi:hypothetical protein